MTTASFPSRAGYRAAAAAGLRNAPWPELAVRLMSGHSSQPAALRDAGRLLHKPCGREQLAQAMAEALGRR